MRYLYAIIFLLLFASNANAQKIRFCDTSNRWKVTVNSIVNPTACNNYEFRQYGADTVINGLSYRYLEDQDRAYVREDTVSGKVFYRMIGLINDNSWVDTLEQVLYDNNWQVGDTTFYQHGNFSYLAIITSADSVQINNVWHKTWYADGMTSFIIEGIGSVYGPLFPLFPSMLDNCRSLQCFENNGIRPTMSDYVGWWFDNSNSCTLSTPSTNRTTQQISIIPNPVTGDSKIIFNSTIKSGQLTVFNSIGQKVIDEPVDDATEYQIGGKIMVRGLYHFMLTDESDNSSYTGKFVY